MGVFLVRDGVAATTSVTSDILGSITRDTVITLSRRISACASRNARSTAPSSPPLTRRSSAAPWEITPVIPDDRLAVGDGRVGALARRLQDPFVVVARGTASARQAWRTPVFARTGTMRAAE